jgi:hypothetical protein
MIRFRETILTPPTRHLMAAPAVCTRPRLPMMTMSVIVAWAKRQMEDAP